MSEVSPITGAGSTVATSSDQTTSALEGPNSMLDREAFLKLLVAQLKFQDPTNPADTSQMLTQSAQLTMVDRLNEIATQMTTSGVSQKLALASSIVGKEVTFLDADGMTHTAVVQTARVVDQDLVLTAGAFTVPMGAVISIGSASPAAAPAAAPTAPPPSVTAPADTTGAPGEPATVDPTVDPTTDPSTGDPATTEPAPAVAA
jgi:flagellar basal-body rod modification protein FlgD